jgi:hypothetical protein
MGAGLSLAMRINTTVYGYDDRFRGIRGTRSVLCPCSPPTIIHVKEHMHFSVYTASAPASQAI